MRLFDLLLGDLLAGVPEKDQPKGRPRVPLREGLFCAVQKVYSQLSCRRSHSLQGFAASRGQIERVHGFVISSRALNREDATPILHDLITRSALPLAGIEQGFAPDSTGMQATSFGAWREEKHGERREHVWLKAHALAGVKTHIIARVSITGEYGGDNPEFEPLLRAAKEGGISPKEVYADMAYSARRNYSVAKELGFNLYVPFRRDVKGRASGRSGKGLGVDRGHSLLWKKAYLFFQMHREEFEAKYHQRSNVESVFSALKRKFGETIRSKNQTAQLNEILAK
ncbi:MAG: transposase, partial [Thermoplasmata archaeon]